MIRLFILAALSFVLQAWPVYCSDSTGQPVTLYVTQNCPPSATQIANMCLAAGYIPNRQPAVINRCNPFPPTTGRQPK